MAAFKDLVGVEDEVLAQHRQFSAAAGCAQILVTALEIGGIGQHREAARAPRRIGTRQAGRVEIAANQSGAWRGLLDLGDQAIAALGEVPFECRREGPQLRRLGKRGKQRRLGERGLGARHMGALLGTDLREHVFHSAVTSASAGALVRMTSPSSARRAAPESSDRAASSMPPSRLAARPATSRAAPLLSSTMSRKGPPAPANRSRISRALCGGAPPRRSSSRALGNPASSATTSKVSTLPSSSAATVVTPAVVSSSRPEPCTTQARSEPSRPSTSAIGRTHSGANTPTSWRGALAGLDSGPSRLKIVRVPSSTRAGATWRVALWWRGAIRKPRPISHRQRRTIAKSASILTPSAVSTSADPDREESARLPCLATGTPQPATTSALAVEMLKLPEASPPVPQVSIAPGGASTTSALARMIRAAPAISSTVSPRTRSAIRKAPICDAVAFPLMMISNAASAWV